MSTCDLTVGGLALEQAPFHLQTHGDREATTPRRSDPVAVEGLAGARFGQLVEEAKPERYKILVTGDVDTEGAAATDRHGQLLLNLAALRKALRQRHDGNPSATFTVDGVTYQADEVVASMSGQAVSDQHFRSDLALTVTGGMWQAETAVETSREAIGSPTVLAISAATSAAPSSLDLFDAVITLSGSATSVLIEQGDRWLDFGSTLGSSQVVLDCGNLTAVRDGSEAVHGHVTRDGGRGWMPISADGSDLTVTPTGGSVDVTVSVRPAW